MNKSNNVSSPPSTGTKPPESSARPPSTKPEEILPSEAGDFITDMIHNLDTHQPGVPRGQNARNCTQPEFSPEP